MKHCSVPLYLGLTPATANFNYINIFLNHFVATNLNGATVIMSVLKNAVIKICPQFKIFSWQIDLIMECHFFAVEISNFSDVFYKGMSFIYSSLHIYTFFLQTHKQRHWARSCQILVKLRQLHINLTYCILYFVLLYGYYILHILQFPEIHQIKYIQNLQSDMNNKWRQRHCLINTINQVIVAVCHISKHVLCKGSLIL